MGLLDVLLGRTKTARSKTQGLFAIMTGQIALADQMAMSPSGRAGVCFGRVSSSYFEEAQAEIQGLLRASEKTSGTRYRLSQDEYGYQWVLLEDEDFEDLVTAIHLVSDTLADHSFKERLLAAAFGFEKDRQLVYWIYNYKSGRFYPFAPQGGGRQRDSTIEMRLAGAMRKELPLERDTSQWYGLWGIPF